MGRVRLVAFLACMTGCQMVAGIDDRVVAPALDSTVADTASNDTGVALDTTTVETSPPDSDPDDAVGDASTTDSLVVDVPVDAPPITAVVINEVRATNGDYVELFNTGTTAVNLSGWGVTGTEDSGGFSIPIRFSAGETIAGGGHLLILAGMPAATGPQTACGTGGPARCYHAPWGISQSRGETLRLLRTDDSIGNEVEYPIDGHADGQSWGRLPDGSGTLAPMKPTPGTANTAL